MKVYCVFKEYDNEERHLVSICSTIIRAETLAEGLKDMDFEVPQPVYTVEERDVF